MSKKIQVAVAGNKGSFSEEAANHYLSKNKIKNYELAYDIGMDNVLTSLEKNEADLGIFPIENSNGGIVYESVYAMSKHNFDIEKIFEIDIKMNLLVKPGTNPGDIKKI
ncbi:MAG TPA: prephenate dehydratase, partial [Bacteroidetes bacterium]|nr:prephenate dehydratase [Bacteroidota bacterium]